MAGFTATLLTFGIGTAIAFGVLFGVFFTICWAIRREDGSGSLSGRAPTRACQSTRAVTGWSWSR
jgi:hypothetical protein